MYQLQHKPRCSLRGQLHGMSCLAKSYLEQDKHQQAGRGEGGGGGSSEERGNASPVAMPQFMLLA